MATKHYNNEMRGIRELLTGKFALLGKWERLPQISDDAGVHICWYRLSHAMRSEGLSKDHMQKVL